MSKLEFKQIKMELQAALSKKLKEGVLTDPNGFTLLDGFINPSISNDISGNLVLGGPTLPMVAVISNTSGQVYYFALKALLPNHELIKNL